MLVQKAVLILFINFLLWFFSPFVSAKVCENAPPGVTIPTTKPVVFKGCFVGFNTDNEAQPTLARYTNSTPGLWRSRNPFGYTDSNGIHWRILWSLRAENTSKKISWLAAYVVYSILTNTCPPKDSDGDGHADKDDLDTIKPEDTNWGLGDCH